jgi:hypothetical protein
MYRRSPLIFALVGVVFLGLALPEAVCVQGTKPLRLCFILFFGLTPVGALLVSFLWGRLQHITGGQPGQDARGEPNQAVPGSAFSGGQSKRDHPLLCSSLQYRSPRFLLLRVRSSLFLLLLRSSFFFGFLAA